MEVYATEEVSHFPNKSSWFMCPEIGVGAHISFTTDSWFLPSFHEEVLIKLILCRYICPDFKNAISMSQLEDRVLTSSSTCIIINLSIGLLVSRDSQGLTYSFFLPDWVSSPFFPLLNTIHFLSFLLLSCPSVIPQTSTKASAASLWSEIRSLYSSPEVKDGRRGGDRGEENRDEGREKRVLYSAVDSKNCYCLHWEHAEPLPLSPSLQWLVWIFSGIFLPDF